MHVDQRPVARQRVDRQRRAQRRAADADVDQVPAPRPARPRGSPRPAAASARAARRPRSTLASLPTPRWAVCSAARLLGRIDDFAGEQRCACAVEIQPPRPAPRTRPAARRQVGLRPVEQDAAFWQFEPRGQLRDAVGIGRRTARPASASVVLSSASQALGAAIAMSRPFA